MGREPLTIAQTPTGYWVVQRGTVPIAGALTLHAAEAELQLLERLQDRCGRRRGSTRARAREHDVPALAQRGGWAQGHHGGWT
jgi:hypothetical protein